MSQSSGTKAKKTLFIVKQSYFPEISALLFFLSLLPSLALNALTQPFSLRLTAPEVNWKTDGCASVTTLTSARPANPGVGRTISKHRAPYPRASVCALAFNPT